MHIIAITFFYQPFSSHTGTSSIPRSSTLLLFFPAVVIIIFFSIITLIGHVFVLFRLVFRLRPVGETDHLIEVGFPPGFPAFLFLRVAAAFCPFDILSATAFGRHAGYFLLDLVDDLRPQGFPVETSRQSSLNHLRNPPLYAIINLSNTMPKRLTPQPQIILLYKV